MTVEKNAPTSLAKIGPKLADLYALLMGLFGVLVLIRLLDYQTMSFDLLTLLPFTLLALLVSYFRVPIGQDDAELGLDGAILLGAMLTAGPVTGGWAAFITGLVTGILPFSRRRIDRSVIANNIVTASLESGRNVVAIGAAWMAFYWLGGTLKPPRITLGLGLALLLMCLSYVLVRSLLAWPVVLLKSIGKQTARLEITTTRKLLFEFIPLPIALLISPAFIQFGWTRFSTLALVLIGSGALMHQMVKKIQSLRNQIHTMALSNQIKQSLSRTPRNTQALCHLARQFCAEIVPAQCEIGLYNRSMTQVTVQSGAQESHPPLMRIPITPFWDWIGEQQDPVCLETPDRINELDLSLPTLASGQPLHSILVAPIRVGSVNPAVDWPDLTGTTAPENAKEQDHLSQDSAAKSDASQNAEKREDSEQGLCTVGALVLLSPLDNAFDDPVLERIQILAGLIGKAIQDAQALSSYDVQTIDQKLARQIQADLILPQTPDIKDWDVAVVCELSAQARDVCTGFFRTSAKDKFVIIEPHSRGFAAAMTGLIVHTLVRVNDAQASLSEAKALETMNTYLRATQQPTALLCVTIDRENILTLINAGCPSPLWWHNTHRYVEELSGTGNALGLTADPVYEEKSLALEPHDVLVLCTNSLLDISNGQEKFGQQRLIQALNQFVRASALDLAAAVMDQISTFCAQEDNEPQSYGQDDVLLAIFRRKEDTMAKAQHSEQHGDAVAQDRIIALDQPSRQEV